MAFQQHYMNELPIKQKVAKVLPYLQKAGFVSDPPPCETSAKLTKICKAAGDRIAVAGDILDFTDFYTSDAELAYDQKNFDKRLTNAPQSVELLREFRGPLETCEPFEAEAIEKLLKSFVESKGAKVGDIIHALRLSVTGKAVGFGMFETLEILGREQSLNRIDQTLARL